MLPTFTTYYHSPIGLIKIVATEHYVQEVSFKDKPEDKYNQSTTIHPLLLQCLNELMEYFNFQRTSFTVPVSQEGTEFQKLVWNELLNIPFGQTISYLQLAKRIEDPKAIRAVANANAKNKIAVLVPCHRVIGADNQLTGYAGGLWRKKALLQLERKVTYGEQTLFPLYEKKLF